MNEELEERSRRIVQGLIEQGQNLLKTSPFEEQKKHTHTNTRHINYFFRRPFGDPHV